jgi:uncharacterized repeat protein (TIGR04002 family)
MKTNKTKNIAAAGIFAAAIMAMTMIHLPIPSEAGYVHLGDGLIYLAASFLPGPYAVAAAAIGGALADLISGYFHWVPFTFVIKALNTVPFIIYFKYAKKNPDKALTPYTVILSAISGIITVLLYFLSTWIIYGNIAPAVAELPGSAVQAIGSSVFYGFVGAALNKSKIKFNRR